MNRSMLRKISNLLVVVLVGLALCAKVEEGGSEALFGKNDIAIVIGAVVLFWPSSLHGGSKNDR